ncbi:MAG: hypothetical protein IV094_06280 [Vitreoscilla sp.]|nr:hypothetical protein [Vitreoscilla sp.]
MSEDDKVVRLKALAREIRDELGEHNVLDALARELAISRLSTAELTQELGAVRRELAAVKLVQRGRDILLPQARTHYAGRRKAVVEAGMPMPSDRGFHALERDGVGNPFRWTGPTSAFHFDFHLDRSVPMRFVLQMPLWGSEHADGLRAFSDDIEVPLLRRAGNRVLDFDGVLMPRETLGVTRLTFAVDHLRAVPADAEETATRQLGVPFMRLSVAEATEQELADWLKVIETNPEDAGKAPSAKASAASSTASATS